MRGGLNESLVESLLEQEHQPGCKQRFLQWFQRGRQAGQHRVLRPSGLSRDSLYSSNLVSNTKYTLLTFLPVVLFNQFKYFQNFFFLMMALTQFVPILKVGIVYTYFVPLAFVLSVTMTKEAFEDIKRHRLDTKANSTQFRVLSHEGGHMVQSRFLQAGDIIEVSAGQMVPADIVLLYSEHREGTLFVKTDQLDGETDWKLRKSARISQALMENSQQNKLFQISCQVSPPSDKIYQFDANMTSPCGRDTQRLTFENCLWASCSVASGKALGLVVHCGKETRIAMGTQQPNQKVGVFDLEMNLLSKILFLVMIVVTIGLVVCQEVRGMDIPNQFIRKLILVSYIFPISVKVNLELARLFYKKRIASDPDIEGAEARNSNVCEEMGRIKYLLTDKTGTLTKNEMAFKRMAAERQNYDIEDLAKMGRAYSAGIAAMLEAMALCNNVTVVDGQHSKYEAASPDQLTLARTALQLGVQIVNRTQTTISICVNTQRKDYDILHNIHFTSQRKRMGILLQSKTDGSCMFLLKGADSVMGELIHSKISKEYLREYCSEQAQYRLRTMVFARKMLSEGEARQWLRQFQRINTKLQDNTQQLQECVNQLEDGVEYLGVSCLQDRLQDNLQSTIESLRVAGIKIWMVTGDKMETAESISVASRMRSATSQSIILEVTEERQLAQGIRDVEATDRRVLMLDGRVITQLNQATKSLKQRLFKRALEMQCVVCYRCSPAQKGDLVKMLIEHRGSRGNRIAAIGDGGNDVGMIENADVGIGLSGREGCQAALAADFSLQQFSHIHKLFVWHGRLSYKRSARLAQYIIYRGMLIGVMHAVFIATYSFISIPLFHGVLQMGYTTIFTFLPTLTICLDEDITVLIETIQPGIALKHSNLYISVQSGKELSPISLAGWAFTAIFQAVSIFYLTTYLFVDQHLAVQTISFTCLVLVQYLVSLLKMEWLNYLSVLAVALSLGGYILTMLFTQHIGVTCRFTIIHIWWIGAIVCVAMLPFALLRWFRKKCDPYDYETVMRREKRKFYSEATIFSERRHQHQEDETRN